MKLIRNLVYIMTTLITLQHAAVQAQSIKPTLTLNGEPASFESHWAPDPAFEYDRLTMRYLRAEVAEDDVWSVQIPQSEGQRVDHWQVLPAASVQVIESSETQISFKLKEPIKEATHLAVLSGSDRLLYLFLDPPNYLPRPATAINVTELGILPDSGALVSDAINQELEKLSLQGGGTLYFPAGEYLISTILMRDDTYLHLSKDAVLLASMDFDAYPLDAPGTEFMDLPKSVRPGHKRRMIFFDHVHNSGVHGQGVIDAQGSEKRRQITDERYMLNHVRMVKSQNISLKGIILRDSEFWSTHLLLSQNIVIDGVKVVNEIPPPQWDRYRHPKSNSTWNNADGINPDSSQNVAILNCFFHTGDDCVPIKNTASYKGQRRDVSNIHIRGAMMVTSTTAMKLGTETVGGHMGNILFEDIEVVYASRVMSTDLKDGITGSNITFRDIRVFQCNRPFDFWIIRRADHPDQQIFSNLQNVIVDNLVIQHHAVENSGGETSHLMGHDAQHQVNGVTFRQVFIEGKQVVDLSFPKIKTNEFIQNIRFE